MVDAVPFRRIGILCHLAVHDGYRRLGLATGSLPGLSSTSAPGGGVVRLYSTRQAKGLYLSLGFRPTAPRTVYRLEEAPRRARAREEADGHRVKTLSIRDLPELYGVDH
jgi:hypothetical protein